MLFSFSAYFFKILSSVEVGFVTSTPSCSPIPKRSPSIPYIPVGSSPTTQAVKCRYKDFFKFLKGQPKTKCLIDIFSWIILDQQTANQSTGNSSLQFQKGSSSSVLYTSQNWDLEDELYEENSFIRMCKKQDVQDELQISKGVTIVIWKVILK